MPTMAATRVTSSHALERTNLGFRRGPAWRTRGGPRSRETADDLLRDFEIGACGVDHNCIPRLFERGELRLEQCRIEKVTAPFREPLAYHGLAHFQIDEPHVRHREAVPVG